jgi:hypothetical protein
MRTCTNTLPKRAYPKAHALKGEGVESITSPLTNSESNS